MPTPGTQLIDEIVNYWVTGLIVQSIITDEAVSNYPPNFWSIEVSPKLFIVGEIDLESIQENNLHRELCTSVIQGISTVPNLCWFCRPDNHYIIQQQTKTLAFEILIIIVGAATQMLNEVLSLPLHDFRIIRGKLCIRDQNLYWHHHCNSIVQ